MEHDAYVERARKTYAIVATSEEATCANILLRKGVVEWRTSRAERPGRHRAPRPPT